MKYRLIASDIDGTLTKVWNQVNPKNREVLHKLVQDGVAFMIATGRGARSAAPILENLAFPCYACLVNGAVLLKYPERQLIETNYLSVDEKNLIIATILEVKGHAVIYNGYERGDKMYYASTYEKSPMLKKIVDNTPNHRLLITDFISEIDHPVPVISCIGTEAEIAAIAELLEPHQSRFNIIKLKEIYDERFVWLMITRKGIDKVHGIKTIAEILGIAREEIIAIGDDLNDLEMIKYAGLGIAMGNAVPELKAVADVIAPPCDEDGMAQIFTEIFQVK